MRALTARCVVVLCILTGATVAALAGWPTGQRVRTEDQNADGRPDIWHHYDHRGRLTEIDVDLNFDGRPDIAEYYEDGALIRRESDRNFNGQTDLVEEFDVDTYAQTRSVVDSDFDGTADLLVLFRDGRPVFSEQAPLRKPFDTLRASSSGIREAGARPLTPLIDPFEAETAVRATHRLSSPDSCVGLSTAGGLPCRGTTTVRPRSPAARLVARHTPSPAQALLLRRSPRAPPVS